MKKIKEKIEEKIAIRKSIEDRIHVDIRNGKDLVKKDLDAIFALSLVITTLEELIGKHNIASIPSSVFTYNGR